MSNLMEIPGVGKATAEDLRGIGVEIVEDLVGRNPEDLYEQHNLRVGRIEDRCELYVFRCAVYYANTVPAERDSEKLKWWNWKDKKGE